MLVSCQLLSPSRWHSMRQIERYHPMIEASMSAAGLRMVCCRLPLPFLSVAGHAVLRSVRLMYVLVAGFDARGGQQHEHRPGDWHAVQLEHLLTSLTQAPPSLSFNSDPDDKPRPGPVTV